MKRNTKVALVVVAAILAMTIGSIAGMAAHTALHIGEAPTHVGRGTTPPPPTDTPAPTPTTTTLRPAADGSVTIAYTFPANGDFQATLHIEVYRDDNELAWGWQNDTLDAPRTLTVSVPQRLAANGDDLVVKAYYTDRSGGFTPFSTSYHVTVSVP